MAQRARITINAKLNSGKVIPGTTIKFNLFYGGSVKQETFYAVSTPTGTRDFSTLDQLGQKVVAIAPNYTYKVRAALGTILPPSIEIEAKYNDDRYNFPPFISSNVNNLWSGLILNNIDPEDTNVTIQRIETTPEEVGSTNGTAKIVASSDSPLSRFEYRIDSGSWRANPLFTGLAAGNYTAHARDSYGGTDSMAFEIESYYPQLKANISKDDPTLAGGVDGEILVTIDSGFAPYSYEWNDGTIGTFTENSGSYSTSKTGLSSGDYSIEITDDQGQTLTLYVTLIEPEGEAKKPWLFVPDLNSLRFVNKQEIDNSRVFATPENTLFADFIQPGITPKGYCQKVSQADVITIQLQSNYESNFLILNNIKTGEEALRVPFERKIQLTNIEEEYEGNTGLAYFEGPAVGSTDTTYIYPYATEFNSSSVVVISGNEDFNGTYVILSRGKNPFTNREYVEINKPITTGEGGSPYVDIKFINDLRSYDVYETIVNFGIPSGYYQAVIESTGVLGSDVLYSEPLSVKPEHEGTVMIEYQNEDNAFSMAYTTGILNRIRVEGRFFKSVPGGETKILRQPNWDITKISASAYRGRLLETYKIPTWMHEKLFAVFQHDHILINKSECQTEEIYEFEYSDPNPYPTDGQIAVEVLGWFDKGNGHDVGEGVTETGLIKVNGGFLKR